MFAFSFLVLVLFVGMLATMGTVLVILTSRMRALERELANLKVTTMTPSPGALPKNHLLEGIRIAISIRQDHKQPLVAQLIRDNLQKLDPVDVQILEEIPESSGFDIHVTGFVTCNGYSDIYYDAELVASRDGTSFLTFAQRPVHGDRPANLAIEFVTRLDEDLRTDLARSERQKALRELREP